MKKLKQWIFFLNLVAAGYLVHHSFSPIVLAQENVSESVSNSTDAIDVTTEEATYSVEETARLVTVKIHFVNEITGAEVATHSVQVDVNYRPYHFNSHLDLLEHVPKNWHFSLSNKTNYISVLEPEDITVYVIPYGSPIKIEIKYIALYDYEKPIIRQPLIVELKQGNSYTITAPKVEGYTPYPDLWELTNHGAGWLGPNDNGRIVNYADFFRGQKQMRNQYTVFYKRDTPTSPAVTTTTAISKASTKPTSQATSQPSTKVTSKPSTKATTKGSSTKPSSVTKKTTKPSTKSSTPKVTPPKTSPNSSLKEVHRLYHSGLKVHLYTTDTYEVSVLQTRGWRYEGISWRTETTKGEPVYRLYNPFLKVHLYTKDANEYQVLANRGWRQEGVAYRSQGSVPVYRLYHEGLRKHLYTRDTNEYQVLARRGWRQEGIAWYSQP